MRKLSYVMNVLLKLSIVFLMGLVVFIDSDVLNSVFMDEIEEIVIEESSANAVVISKTNTQLTGRVVVNDEELTKDYVTTLSIAEANTWVWPTESNYRITSYYGYRWGKLHGAIDIVGPGYGSNIYAVNKGTVVTVKGGCVAGNTSCNGSGGNYVVIKHNVDNYYTVYMHLKDIRVSVGTTVSRGQIIGTMGNTGSVSPVPSSSNPYAGTHLHFALYIGEPYKGGYAVNPMRLY